MPEIPLTEEQARQIAAYILSAPLDPALAMAIPVRLPVLARRIGFAEVNERVFRRSCWHCHSSPDYALGDGGPGNTGGFGFRPRGLPASGDPLPVQGEPGQILAQAVGVVDRVAIQAGGGKESTPGIGETAGGAADPQDF